MFIIIIIITIRIAIFARDRRKRAPLCPAFDFKCSVSERASERAKELKEQFDYYRWIARATTQQWKRIRREMRLF